MSLSRPATLDDLERLLAVTLGKRDRCFFLLAAASGARLNALRLARVAQVLDSNGRLTGALELPARANKRRARLTPAPLSPRASHALAAWLQAHPCPARASYLFPASVDGARPWTARTWQRRIRAAARRAGLPDGLTPHSLRKLFGTRVYHLTGRDTAAAARALGHASLAATARYLAIDDAKLESIRREVLTDPRDLIC